MTVIYTIFYLLQGEYEASIRFHNSVTREELGCLHVNFSMKPRRQPSGNRIEPEAVSGHSLNPKQTHSITKTHKSHSRRQGHKKDRVKHKNRKDKINLEKKDRFSSNRNKQSTHPSRHRHRSKMAARRRYRERQRTAFVFS